MTEFFATLQAIFTNRVEGDEGATAVEYGLMVALIAVIIIGAVTALGQAILAIFNQAAAAI
jgi:pilus assembly protein Flp/PilA